LDLKKETAREKIPGTQYKIIDPPPFFTWTFRAGLFIPELFSQQHLKLINAQITPKRTASSLMPTEFLIFFLLKFVFNNLLCPWNFVNMFLPIFVKPISGTQVCLFSSKAFCLVLDLKTKFSYNCNDVRIRSQTLVLKFGNNYGSKNES